jgi:hypothetical protein
MRQVTCITLQYIKVLNWLAVAFIPRKAMILDFQCSDFKLQLCSLPKTSTENLSLLGVPNHICEIVEFSQLHHTESAMA